MTPSSHFCDVPTALEEIRAGRMIVVVDDEDRENEGDLTLAAEKDSGFDLYWFAVALNRSAGFPDELERWPVKMLQPLEPTELKQQFQRLALQLLARVTNE